MSVSECLCFCLFVNSFETANPIELKFEGLFPLECGSFYNENIPIWLSMFAGKSSCTVEGGDADILLSQVFLG